MDLVDVILLGGGVDDDLLDTILDTMLFIEEGIVDSGIDLPAPGENPE